MNGVPRIRTKLPGPKARQIIARDKKYFSQSVTRPYPLVMESGEGAVVTDVDGNRFLDFTAGIAVCSTGHAHPRVVDAIQEQSMKFLHMSGTDFYYDLQSRVAQRLAEITPGKFPKKVFLCNSGAESIEGAMKLARYATGRQKIISFYGSFHGRTYGALSLTASKTVQRRRFGPFLPEIYHAEFGEIDSLERLFRRVISPDEVAAIVVEPVQGEGGYIVPPKEFFPALRRLADKHGILLVVDEVQSGMGRTGKMFAIEHWGVAPDILCLAKGVASGMPLGAIVARADLMRWGPGSHGSTFGGNPVSCAAALVTIDLIEKELVHNAAKQGVTLKEKLLQLQKKHPGIANVRGLGLMAGFDLLRGDKKTVVLETFREGLLILGCGENAIRFSPPLLITKKEIDIAFGILEKVFTRLKI